MSNVNLTAHAKQRRKQMGVTEDQIEQAIRDPELTYEDNRHGRPSKLYVRDPIVVVVNRDTGDKRLISPEVVQYSRMRERSALTTAQAPLPIRIVYVVRGRNPSAQDGLWIATVTDADLH